MLIGVLAFIVFLITSSIPVVLITLGFATYLSSHGMTLVQGVAALALCILGLLQTIIAWISQTWADWQPAIERSIEYVSARYQPALESRSVDVNYSQEYSMPPTSTMPSPDPMPNHFPQDQPSLNHLLQNPSTQPQLYPPPTRPPETTSASRCLAMGGQKMLRDYQDCSYRAFYNDQYDNPCLNGGFPTRIASSRERTTATFSERIVGFLCNSLPGLGRRPRGLYNNGRNLCFMNSVLQCLARTPFFPRELNSVLASTEGLININVRPERPVAIAVANLLLELLGLDGITISQNKFRCLASRLNNNLIAPPEGDSRQPQQDAAEFTMWLLATLHSALNLPNGNRFPIPTQPIINSLQPFDNLMCPTQDVKQALHTLRQELLQQIRQTQCLDGQELLIPLQRLSELEWMVYSMSNQSLIDRMFTGQLAELHQCLACNRISVHIDTFTVLPVVVPSAKQCTLEDCVNLFHNIVPLDGTNGLQCECCNPLPKTAQSPNSNDSGYVSMDTKNIPTPILSQLTLTEGRKRTILCRLPECLIIQLMRFRYDRIRRQCSKIHTRVLINPNCLDLTHYALNSTYLNLQNPPYQFAYRYQMYGLCLHQGGENTSYGHYVAFAPDFDGNWYHLEDEEVYRESNIENILTTKSVQENAYILFYHLKR